jgi:cyclopropane-fatty-acyl-phospholipid synthase
MLEKTAAQRPAELTSVHDGAESAPAAHAANPTAAVPGAGQPDVTEQRRGKPSRLERGLLERLLKIIGHPPLAIELWDGTQFVPPQGKVVGRLIARDRGALWKVLLDPVFQFGEMYAAGRLDVQGPLDQVMTELFRAMRAAEQPTTWLSKLAARIRRPRPTTQWHSKQNIHHHYDIGNDFYRLWLDREHLAYTCAYFPHAQATLEEAQTAKLEHVCRKLRLAPEMVVFEAGCGWGGLALYMAKQHGVRVKAYNISREQVIFARRRALEAGLADRVEFIEDDWRNISGKCDVFVSVGMLEHVGRRNYRQLGDVIDRVLSPDGRGLIHTIGQNQSQPFSPWIERRIFPGAYTPTLAEMMDLFAPHDFNVLDVENLRLHYAQTLRHWLARFEQHLDEVRTMFDEQFIRMWRLYLAGSIAAFEASIYQLYQVVFQRPNNNDIPWTREYLYEEQKQQE